MTLEGRRKVGAGGSWTFLAFITNHPILSDSSFKTLKEASDNVLFILFLYNAS